MFNGRTVNDLKQCLGVVHATSTDEALGVGSNNKKEHKSQIYDNVDLFNVKYKTWYIIYILLYKNIININI